MNSSNKNIKAMIFAAGRGTRLGELGLTTPKALIKINNSTAIEQIINKIKKLGIKEIIINVHHLKDQIIEHLNACDFDDLKIQFSIEQELLETGGGLKNALNLIGNCDGLLIHNADVYSEIKLEILQAKFLAELPDVLLCIQKRDSSRVLLCDSDKNIVGWENTKINKNKLRIENSQSVENYSFTGIQCVNMKFLDRIRKHPDNKFSIMDTYFATENNDLVIKGLDVTNQDWFDLGTIEKIQAARSSFKL
jgi:MurNAc alpha-1-phosphate uridylyltransferase